MYTLEDRNERLGEWLDVSSEGKGIWFLAEATRGEWDALQGKQEDLRLQVCTCWVSWARWMPSCTQFWAQKAAMGTMGCQLYSVLDSEGGSGLGVWWCALVSWRWYSPEVRRDSRICSYGSAAAAGQIEVSEPHRESRAGELQST